jgi:ubiquinol-cytochrome c reductase cytochrome b subunit
MLKVSLCYFLIIYLLSLISIHYSLDYHIFIIIYIYINHISYYVSYLGMNYNNVIGFFLFIIFVIQFVSGLLLSCYYSDYYNIAFDSIVYIMSDVNIGWFIRLVIKNNSNLHFLIQNLLILIILWDHLN